MRPELSYIPYTMYFKRSKRHKVVMVMCDEVGCVSVLHVALYVISADGNRKIGGAVGTVLSYARYSTLNINRL